jgi:hypothetical protein
MRPVITEYNTHNNRVCVNTIYTDHTQLARDRLGRDSWERRQPTYMTGKVYREGPLVNSQKSISRLTDNTYT